MRQSGRFVAALGVALAASIAVPAAAQDLAAALRAIDDGRPGEAQPVLQMEVALVSYYQALAEEGDARTAAAMRARDLAGDGNWLSAAAAALLSGEAGDTAAAVAGFERATSLSPNDPRLWFQLGEARRAAGENDGARAAYERATALDPSHRSALLRLGDLQRAANDLAGAFNSYNHAIDDAQAPLAALLGRGTTRMFLHDEAGALADFERAAVEAPPGDDRSRALMGSLYVHAYERQLPQGLDKAEEAARMWAELGRADRLAGTMNAAARVLLETGDPNSAEQWYERGWQAVEASAMPEAERTIWRVRLLHGRARCAAARRETDAAGALAAEARDLMQSDEANREHYAWIEPYLNGYLLLASRRPEAARAQLEGSDVERPYIRLLLAEAYARTRDRENARLWYERALAAATQLDAESVITRPEAESWLEKNR